MISTSTASRVLFAFACGLALAAAAPMGLRSSFAPPALQRGWEHDVHDMPASFLNTPLRVRNNYDDFADTAYKPGATADWDIVFGNDQRENDAAYKPGQTSQWDIVLGDDKDQGDMYSDPDACSPSRPCTFC
eukprot:CAMPEP_0181320022 /NCGR_PEP_ID=MMETSP1101-20121128/17893_1 /TAXON_ID=46948 /ORGANISM="Rhodomonas abbreviata, Strain Caron Lab Isolate" /LENGTH=131 /DNA_ID=CAMNT_0023427681 /DNA_START=6 /DNA_END=401 /DNA_ORIENTATION=+